MPKPPATNPISLLLIVLLLAVPLGPALARDLEAASDGEHLWLVVEDPDAEDGPGRLVYHHAATAEAGQAVKLPPIDGAMMPRGIAAGGGRLLMVTGEGELQTLHPVWSQLLRRYVFEIRSLPDLPKGASLLSIAVNRKGPWALVKVQSADLLRELDQADQKQTGLTKQQRRNLALGLPRDYVRPTPDQQGGDAPGEGNATPEEQEEEAEEETQPDSEAQPNEITPAESEESEEAGKEADTPPAAEPALPAYRLIHLRSGRWASAPLPDDFVAPRHAVLLLRTGDDRPTLIVEPDNPNQRIQGLVRYTPVTPITTGINEFGDDAAASTPAPSSGANAESNKQAPPTPAKPAWSASRNRLPITSDGLWSAVLVKEQIVVAVQPARFTQMVLIDTYPLRLGRDDTNLLGSISLKTTGNARWAAIPWAGAVGIIARPISDLQTTDESAKPLAALAVIDLQGQLVPDDQGNSLTALYADPQAATQGNADLYIQIATFLIAMLLMLLYFRRAPRPGQFQLNENVVLASFGRRIIAGMIDLAPGFWIAGALYSTTINETLLYWPGNGVPKVLPAMLPGFVVILVTLVHTTIAEFILARSLGKWVTGLYVADLTGKPAPPLPSLLRALSRVFELFAPLMLVIAIVSPARQRLGDILARTTVVMQRPPEIKFDDDND